MEDTSPTISGFSERLWKVIVIRSWQKLIWNRIEKWTVQIYPKVSKTLVNDTNSICSHNFWFALQYLFSLIFLPLGKL